MTYNQAFRIRNEYQCLVTQPGGINLIPEVVIAPENHQQEFVDALTADDNELWDMELIASFEDSSYTVLVISNYDDDYAVEDYTLYSEMKDELKPTYVLPRLRWSKYPKEWSDN